MKIFLINYHCISCKQEYQNYSTASENKSVNTCANCSPAYKGEASVKERIGREAKFYERQQAAQEKAKNK
jgi:ribosomal protein L31